jgi:hypothetical protein
MAHDQETSVLNRGRFTDSQAPVDIILAGRDHRLDLFRSISLWFLFLEQTPPSNSNLMTLHDDKFSVAVAIFVLLFGYTAGLVYGRVMRDRGLYLATAKILRRAWQVYVAQVLLFVFHIIQIDSMSRDNPQLTEITRVSALLQHPYMGLFHGMSLNYQPADTEVLALYIVLLLAFAPALWLLLRAPILALAGSAALYLLTVTYGWNLPAYPTGVWPLNPFAWQLLFVVGAWFGIRQIRSFGILQTDGSERILIPKTARVFATLYLVLALVVWIGARVLGFSTLLPAWLNGIVQPSSATSLDAVVLLHVVSIVVVALWIVPADWAALTRPVLRPLLLCGRYPLATLCFGVLLAFASRSLFLLSNARATHIAFVLGGIVLMTILAQFLALLESVTRQPIGA